MLAHLSGTAPADDGDDGGVAILRVNRNAAVLIDSDRRTAHDPLNRTKERIISEVQAFGGLAWVTDGREVENYTASTVIAKWLPDINVSDLSDTHEDFFEYLERLDPVKGKTFVHKKPLLAEQLAALTERSDLEGQPVLARRLEQLCEQVRRWNSLPLLAS